METLAAYLLYRLNILNPIGAFIVFFPFPLFVHPILFALGRKRVFVLLSGRIGDYSHPLLIINHDMRALTCTVSDHAEQIYIIRIFPFIHLFLYSLSLIYSIHRSIHL